MASSGNDDPRCPECDGPVAATSTYCMHCGADLEAVDAVGMEGEVVEEGDAVLDDSADVSDADDVPWGADESATATGGADADAGVAGGGATGTGGGTGDASRLDGWVDAFQRHLGPDGMIDDSLTVLLGVVAGVVIGIGTLMVAGIATGSWISLVVALGAWLGSTAVLARQRTVLGALRLGCYAVALLLVLLPVTAFSPVVGVDGGLVSRAVTFLIGELVLVVPVLALVIVGFVAGRARPDSVRESAGEN